MHPRLQRFICRGLYATWIGYRISYARSRPETSYSSAFKLVSSYFSYFSLVFATDNIESQEVGFEMATNT